MFKVTGIFLVLLVIESNWRLTHAGSATNKLVPLIRLHRIYDNYNLIATESDANFAVLNYGFVRKNVIGSVVKTNTNSVNDIISIYRMYKAGTSGKDDHLFTYSESEVNLAVNTVGYRNEGVRFYCARSSSDCNAQILGHFYTTNFEEGNEIVAAGGKYEDILCYIWQ